MFTEKSEGTRILNNELQLSSASSSTPWGSYRRRLERDPHAAALVSLTEDMLYRVAWVIPSQYRQILWTALQLHHLALVQPEGSRSGTTMDAPGNQPTRIRVLLTLLQGVYPTVVESSRLRMWLERVRFVLRLSLLMQSWRTCSPTANRWGLLQCGGLFMGPLAVPQTLERAQHDRLAYVGARTGRRLLRPGEAVRTSTTVRSLLVRNAKIMLSDLLYTFRPLFWATMEAKNGGAWKNWVLSLGIDVSSLCLLDQSTQRSEESYAFRNECRRRKLRLLLYLLRGPVGPITERNVDEMCDLVARFPLLGPIVSFYLQDWIYYWKECRMEEG